MNNKKVFHCEISQTCLHEIYSHKGLNATRPFTASHHDNRKKKSFLTMFSQKVIIAWLKHDLLCVSCDKYMTVGFFPCVTTVV